MSKWDIDICMLNNFENALKLYKEILKINPKHEKSLWKIGDILNILFDPNYSLREQRFYYQARQNYEKCIIINSNNSATQQGIGECLIIDVQFNFIYEILSNLKKPCSTIQKLLRQTHPKKSTSILKEIVYKKRKNYSYNLNRKI